MPIRKKTYRKRKPYKKRYRKKRYRKRKFLPVGGFSNSMLVKLRYCQTFTLNAGAGTYAVQKFLANSLYDPDSTGVGHQPSNFDRLSALYDRYTVIGAKIKVIYVPLSSTYDTPPPLLCCILSEDGNTIATAHGAGGVDNIMEQPRLARSLQNVGRDRPTILNRSFSAKKFFKTKCLIGQDLYSVDVTANPAEGAYFEVAAVSPNDSVDPAEVTLRCEIEYIAVLTEPKLADAS